MHQTMSLERYVFGVPDVPWEQSSTGGTGVLGVICEVLMCAVGP